jgi:hypothetical protein
VLDTAQPSRSSLPGQRPDVRFGLAVGSYVAALFAVPMTAVAWPASGWPSVPTSLTLLGSAIAICAVVTLAATRVGGLAVRLGATPWRWGLAAVPLFVLGGVVLSRDGALSGRLQVAVVTTAGLIAFGYLVAMMSRTRYTAAVVDGATVIAEWEARPAPTHRRLQAYGSASLVVLGLAAFFFESELIQALGQMLIASAFGIFGMRSTDRYRASAAGLEAYGLAGRSLVPWEDCTGYTVTDGAIVVHRRRPFSSIGFDREDVDADAVVDVLSSHLDEQ